MPDLKSAVRPVLCLAAVLAAGAAFAGSASANAVTTGPFVYWASAQQTSIMRTVIASGTTQTFVASLAGTPNGVAVDRTDDRVYWSLPGMNLIQSAASDGSDGQTLNTFPSVPNGPAGVAIDPARHRVLWANSLDNTIGWVDLTNGGGGTLNTGSAVLNTPSSIAVDPLSDRVYWTNVNMQAGVPPVSWAALDGSGTSGGLGNPNGTTYSLPSAVTVDANAGQIYFADFAANHINQIGEDGSGEHLVLPANAYLSLPTGLNFDPSLGRIYIANNNGPQVSYFDTSSASGGALYSGTDAAIGNPAVSGAGAAQFGGSLSGFVGSSQTGAITVTNTGDYALTILGDGLQIGPKQFTLAAGGDCVKRVIPVGATCSIPIDFAPTTAGPQSTQLALQTDAGSFHTTVNADATPVILSALSTVRRCAAPQNGAKLSVKFSLNHGQKLSATLSRQKGVNVLATCPRRASGAGPFSGSLAAEDRASLSGASGTQTKSLKQIFGTKKLAPGHYRVQLSYTDWDGALQRRTAWVWVTDS